MNILLEVYGGNINYGSLFKRIEWNLPFSPQIGHYIGANFINKHIEPDLFYKEIRGEEKEDWDIYREKLKMKGESENIENECFYDWADSYYFKVKDCFWGYTEKFGITVTIHIELEEIK